MMLAYVMTPERGETDLLLTALAHRLLAEGRAVVAAVQSNQDCETAPGCDMDLAILPDGPVIRISQNLGPESKGCKLDAGALEQAVEQVSQRMAGARALILNKFGKHEAEGRGFRTLIGQALADGLPVLLGVNARNAVAFQEFAGEMAAELPADPVVLTDWLAERMIP
ncbi:DUF2478 domain-containing protein [Neogemmobacter tilapiae]|uniref:DUF2478 domain-containing protein n=1 Tax=Neogemmobacter tilapiae TaxID=875041 RepID=A0A918WP13_9RHOB|nr:DUF2478 domain-containing protein [Gemmobacter tilapiae]GHC66990.1 hypothetical protein GCM10007315_34930 [Gemmobacter tilapiae]